MQAGLTHADTLPPMKTLFVQRNRRLAAPLLVVAFALLALLPATLWAQSPFTNHRQLDPVVVKGSNLGSWPNGLDADSLVAFAWRGGAWVQVPIQIDEMLVADIAAAYGPDAAQYYTLPTGVNLLYYADAGTFVGADPDATFDVNDELAFMARDAGGLPPTTGPWTDPAGVVPASCLRLDILDAQNQDTGYVFLYKNGGSLRPDADTSYLTYNFVLNAGTYPVDYNILQGPNPENTTVVTPHYSHHFADRWTLDELKITVGTATGVDILDRYQNFFAPGVCGRTEDSFSNGEGCFATNKAGPIRVIRSYFGANSGPLTQRTHWFYDTRHDIQTDLRVHTIPSVYDVFDYSTAAIGMVNTNNLNPNGTLVINGQPDAGVNTNGVLSWELVTGPQGSLVVASSLGGNIAPGLDCTLSTYWEDQTTNPVSDCTGDGLPYGTSGLALTFVSNRNICTDPVGGNCGTGAQGYRTVQAKRSLYFQAPGLSATDAQSIAAQSAQPLQVQFQSCQGTAVADFTASAPQCAGVPVQFTDASTQFGAPTWAWSFPGGTPDTSNVANPVVVYGSPGLYDVRLQINGASVACNDCILVDAPPVAAFGLNPNPVVLGDSVRLTNTSTGAATYQWFVNGVSVSSDTDFTYTPTATGALTVRLVASSANGCLDTLDRTLTVDAPSALTPNVTGTLTHVVLYPQPAAGTVTLQLPPATSVAPPVQAVVYDLQGRALLAATLTAPTAQLALDTLPAGSYFVRLVAHDGSQAVRPLVVVR